MKTLLYIALTIIWISTSVSSFAQGGPEESPVVKQKLASAEGQIAKIESLFAKIEKETEITEVDIKALDEAMLMHANDLTAAAKEALREAQESAKVDPKKVKLGSLQSFEKTATAHEARARKLQVKAVLIEARVIDGDSLPEAAVLEKMTPGEKEKFKKSLLPDGQRKLEKRHPKIFPPGQASITSDLWFVTQRSTSTIGAFLGDTAKEVGNILVPPAEATLVSGGLLACSGTVGVGCVAVTVAGVLLQEWAEGERNRCLASKAWWDSWGKAACWAWYVAFLA